MKIALSAVSMILAAACGVAADKPGFAWKDAEGEHPILMYRRKPVLEYVHPIFDKAINAKNKDGGISNPTTKIFTTFTTRRGTVADQWARRDVPAPSRHFLRLQQGHR